MTTTNNIVGLFHFSLLLLLAFFIVWPTSSSASMLTKYHVHIINDLPKMGANIFSCSANPETTTKVPGN